MSKIYTVKQGETIVDICLNATGTINNWSLILDANNFTSWTPLLFAGQNVTIPDGVEMQTNVLRGLLLYPACNNNQNRELSSQISELISKFTPPTNLFEDEYDYTFEDEVEYSFENG
jgi:phage tail protein X